MEMTNALKISTSQCYRSLFTKSTCTFSNIYFLSMLHQILPPLLYAPHGQKQMWKFKKKTHTTDSIGKMIFFAAVGSNFLMDLKLQTFNALDASKSKNILDLFGQKQTSLCRIAYFLQLLFCSSANLSLPVPK